MEDGNDLDEIHSSAENEDKEAKFLSYFNLQRVTTYSTEITAVNGIGANRESWNYYDNDVATKATSMTANDPNVTTGNNSGRCPRHRYSLLSNKCATIPLSSPAGKVLLRNSNHVIDKEYIEERLIRTEKFCAAPPLSQQWDTLNAHKQEPITKVPRCTFKKPRNKSSHVFQFPKRQYLQPSPPENVSSFVNSVLLQRCKPCKVRVKRLSEQEIRSMQCQNTSKLTAKVLRDANSGNIVEEIGHSKNGRGARRNRNEKLK